MPKILFLYSIQQAKAHIRQLLPQGLSESISKVRSSIAYAVSAIAHWDWPELWPELFPLLMQALSSGQPDAVHGAMRVLTGRIIIILLFYPLNFFFLQQDGEKVLV